MSAIPFDTQGEILDHATQFKHTIELRVLMPTFQIGEKVEVYYSRTKRWHSAVVRYIWSDFEIYLDAKHTSVKAWSWHYRCDVLDQTIAAEQLDVIEWGTDNNTIREVQP